MFVAGLVLDILVLGLVTLGVVVTDEAAVEADSLVLPLAGEVEVRVGAGLTVLARCQTTLKDKYLLLPFYFVSFDKYDYTF